MMAAATVVDWLRAVVFWPAIALAIAWLIIYARECGWWWHDDDDWT
jgi:hypothetical protein